MIWPHLGPLVTARVVQAHSLASQGLPLLVPTVTLPTPTWISAPPAGLHDLILGPSLANRELMFPIRVLSATDQHRCRLIETVQDGFRGVFASFSQDRSLVRPAAHPYLLTRRSPVAPVPGGSRVLPYTPPPPNVFWFFPHDVTLERYAAISCGPVSPGVLPSDTHRKSHHHVLFLGLC